MIKTPLQFADAVGRKQIASALGIKDTAVSNAVVRGKFPSSWFNVLEAVARDAGIDCPRGMFRFKHGDSSQNVSVHSNIQGA